MHLVPHRSHLSWIYLSFAARTTATDTGNHEQVWIHCPADYGREPALPVLAERVEIGIVGKIAVLCNRNDCSTWGSVRPVKVFFRPTFF